MGLPNRKGLLSLVRPKQMKKSQFLLGETCPVGNGRPLVRAINASIFSSIKQLKAAAAPLTKAIPMLAAIRILIGTMPGVAKNIPIMAVKTINAVTLGLHRA